MLLSEESELGKWSLTYIAPKGNRYSGTMIITNFRLLFLNYAGKNKMTLELQKSDISSVSIIKKLVKKTVIISVEGRKHSFSGIFFNPQNLINFIKN